MSAVGNCAVQRYNVGIVFACAIGLGLSYYAYAVETKREQDDSYTPLCDISEHISCTKVFMTEFGKGFGLFPKDSVFNVPNSLYGLAFYTQIAILSMSNNYTCSIVVIALGIVSNIFSLYLAHILYLYRDICIVCVSTYIVNAVIVFLAINKFRKLDNICKKKKKQF
ncbi:vitamin K epoxide reductase complex subunit 1-like protein 1 [Pogonomyrmex barbatus]|uniref:vitamin-K-epoxide reductase (warfarin-sensitive) n=1 Tax=Pogonomyrmex barbatus TaxID=144034 RepID=A0A6I9W1D1_9HYME|nr:vitamin K epoxide reductase complex subunit 1-like protein 1 [Pogonomyrmex barbatus]